MIVFSVSACCVKSPTGTVVAEEENRGEVEYSSETAAVLPSTISSTASRTVALFALTATGRSRSSVTSPDSAESAAVPVSRGGR